MEGRGMLTNKAKEIAKEFLGREIEVKELRLYPYIDYCLKNQFQLNRVSKEEIVILDTLSEGGHLVYGVSYIRCTREFYDYIQDMLAETYVPDFLPKEVLESVNKE